MAFDKKKFKQAMKRKGVTQRQLADKFGVELRTISRWLDPRYSIKSDRVRDLCFAIDEAPSTFDSTWEGTVEVDNVARVSAKVSSASKNGYWLLKKMYGVSETEIVELAPTLFAMFVASIYENPRRNNDDERKKAAEILAREYDLIPMEAMYPTNPEEEEADGIVEDYISQGKIFGGEMNDHYGGYTLNPFAIEMEEFVRGSNIVDLSTTYEARCPNSVGNAIFIPDINAISGNDPEISQAIAYGQIELFSKEFEDLRGKPEQRIKWMAERISENKKEQEKREKERLKLMSPELRKQYEELILERPERRDEYLRKRWRIS